MGVLALHALHEFEAIAPWPPLRRRKTVQAYAKLASDPSPASAQRLVAMMDAESHPRLSNLPMLVERIGTMSAQRRRMIWHHAKQAAQRSLAYSLRARSNGHVLVRDAKELVGFCNSRMGIVTELTTEILLTYEPALTSVAEPLRDVAASPGQVVGLVDFLEGDESSCPACALDPVERSRIRSLSWEQLTQAEMYLSILRRAGANREVLAFAALPLAWAKSRLDRIQCCEEGTSDEPQPPALVGVSGGLQRPWR